MTMRAHRSSMHHVPTARIPTRPSTHPRPEDAEVLARVPESDVVPDVKQLERRVESDLQQLLRRCLRGRTAAAGRTGPAGRSAGSGSAAAGDGPRRGRSRRRTFRRRRREQPGAEDVGGVGGDAAGLAGSRRPDREAGRGGEGLGPPPVRRQEQTLPEQESQDSQRHGVRGSSGLSGESRERSVACA